MWKPSQPIQNSKHEKFAQEIAKARQGEGSVEAYRKVAGTGKSGEYVMACKWLKKVNIQQRINFLKEKSATSATLTVTERRAISAAIARDFGNEPAVRLQATVIEAKHAGEFMERNDLTTNGETLPAAMPQIIFNMPASFNRDRKKRQE